MKNEKGKDNEQVRKSIALKTSSSKPLKYENNDYEERNDKNYEDYDFVLYIKKYQRYIRKNRVNTSKET